MAFGVVLVAISLVYNPSFSQRIPYLYVVIQDYALGLDHVNCDVLIYGDSSTMSGADPDIIEASTHLKTCNIAQTQPVVLNSGTLPIDIFLRKNRAPKYLVIQLAPDTLYQSHQLDAMPVVEPVTFMLRHDPGSSTTMKLIRNPAILPVYAKIVLASWYATSPAQRADFDQKYGPTIKDYLRRGLLTLPKPPETNCMTPRKLFTEDLRWVEDARKRYSAEGIKVLLIISPIPECDLQVEVYRRTLASQLGVEINTLPLRMFNDGDRHFTREGSAVVSDSIARKILVLEEKSGG
jgi:hypothetical protein